MWAGVAYYCAVMEASTVRVGPVQPVESAARDWDVHGSTDGLPTPGVYPQQMIGGLTLGPAANRSRT
jgi:hypothetical protein